MVAPRVSPLLLQATTLFADLAETTSEDIALGALRRAVPKGATIASAGELPQYLFAIVSGVAHPVMTDSAGNQVILSVLKADDNFCDAELPGDSPHISTVVAHEDCEALTITKSKFRDLIVRHFALSQALFRHLPSIEASPCCRQPFW
jgi:CRP-like cAMP-binding protein